MPVDGSGRIRDVRHRHPVAPAGRPAATAGRERPAGRYAQIFTANLALDAGKQAIMIPDAELLVVLKYTAASDPVRTVERNAQDWALSQGNARRSSPPTPCSESPPARSWPIGSFLDLATA